MNKYEEMKNRHQREVNGFPFMFAFSQDQFENGMRERLGLDPEKDTDKICSIGGGGYIRKSDSKKLAEMSKRHEREMQEAIDNDVDGTGFIKDMFKCELASHEFCITYDYDDTLDALGLTVDEVTGNEKLLKGLALAKKEYLAECK